MINIDTRINSEGLRILQSVIGKTINRIEHDEFMFTNTSSQAVKFVSEEGTFYLYSFTETLDYYGSEEDVAVWSVEKQEYPFIGDKNFISMPIKEKVSAIHLLQEHQMLFEHSRQTYDVWLTRGIIIDFGDHEVAFEKPVWFSEDIVIWKGYNLEEKFQPVEDICKAENWAEEVSMECIREIVTL